MGPCLLPGGNCNILAGHPLVRRSERYRAVLPIINIFCAVPEDGDATTFTSTCKEAIDGVDPKSLLVTIDGKKVQNLYKSFRAGEFFAFTGVEGNIRRI